MPLPCPNDTDHDGNCHLCYATQYGCPQQATLISQEITKIATRLADRMRYNWSNMTSQRDAADHILNLLASHQLLERYQHPHGSPFWVTHDDKLLGRTDGITIERQNNQRKVYHTIPETSITQLTPTTDFWNITR